MRKRECQYCGYVYIPTGHHSRKWRRDSAAWTCPRCGEKNRPKGRGR